MNITYTATRSCPTLAREWNEKALNITVTARAYTCGGNAHPHFAVTADIYRPGYSRDPMAGGCMHEEVLRYFPKLAPLVALHLSNADDGEPMHGEANGFYWLAGALGGLGERYHGGSGDSGKTANECLRIFQEHIRTMPEETAAIAVSVKVAFEQGRKSVAPAVSLPCLRHTMRSKAGSADGTRTGSPSTLKRCNPGRRTLMQAAIPLDGCRATSQPIPQTRRTSVLRPSGSSCASCALSPSE